MSLRRWMPAAAIAALLALPLAACTPAQPTPTSTPTSAHTPLFASDEEALKAATDAYAAYLKVTDEVMADGGANPGRFRAVATGSALKDALTSANEFRTERVHSTGTSAFDSVRLQSSSEAFTKGVTVYLCDDTSKVDVFDSSGRSIVAPDRATRVPFVVTVSRSEHSMLVSRREHWDGTTFC